uniref:Putative tnf receptor-associated factor 6 n=1 Tax=Ixodes ricinus TaxID=34613 RepID=A0A131Y4N7_IXORI
MASKGRTKASRKDSVIFKVEQMKWLSKDYYIYGTSIPEKIRCHGCRCVSNTIYPLENECQGHGLCKDCKKNDFTCHNHGGHVTAEALRNAVGQTNNAAKKLEIRCLFCESIKGFLNIKDHMYEEHPRLVAAALKRFQKTKYEQEKPASTQEKHRTSPLTWREDHFSQNADVTVESEDDEAAACEHCKEEWDARELGEHEKACPQKKVQCRDCDEWIKQEQLLNHKKSCQFGKCNFCNEKMGKEEMTTHEDICEEKKIPCCYHTYGCNEEDKRKNIRYHEEYDSHALFFLPKIQELQERIRQLEPPIKAIMKRLQPSK